MLYNTGARVSEIIAIKRSDVVDAHCSAVLLHGKGDKQGKATHLDLLQAAHVSIIRHVKIRADATPYDPAFRDYFARRQRSRRVNPFVWTGAFAEAWD